jgi:NADH-quinone oxidoreductase subunit L
MDDFPLHLIPLLPLAGAAINLIFGRHLKRETVHLIALIAVLGALALACDAIFVKGLPMHQRVYTWIETRGLSIHLSFLLDQLSAVLVFTITFVGFLIHVYSTGYMAHDPRYATYFGYLNLFTGMMLILVLGDSLPVMFIGWEGVGLCSYLLIGFWYDKEKNANAGRKAFIVNRIGDFAFLLGIFFLYWSTRAMDFASLEASARMGRMADPLIGMRGPPLALVGGLLLFIGACGKSAQIPLYVWLPDAMAGPTPVSALIHAATMVTAGVYMIARLNFVFTGADLDHVMMIVAGIGALTALFAAIIGFAQTDIKRVLAYSTVSQLGFMFAAVGTGAFAAGMFHMFTHAFFKAGLFLGAGSVMHAMGDRGDIMEMGGLRKRLPITHACFLIYCLAIAGIVPFAGFFSKDEILLSAFTAHLPGWPVWYGKLLWAMLTVAAFGTAFYMWRLYFLVFSGESRADEHTRLHAHESPPSMTIPLVVLAAGSVVLGFLGIPHAFGVKNLFVEWLSPVIPALHQSVPAATELGLMAIATGLAVIGIYLAYSLYKDGPGEGVRRLAAAISPVRRVVANKFYVDEIYDFILVRPFRWLCTAAFNVIDRFLIDLVLVNGSAFVVEVAGRLTRWWQNGDVQRYLAVMLVAAAVIFWQVLFGGAK